LPVAPGAEEGRLPEAETQVAGEEHHCTDPFVGYSGEHLRAAIVGDDLSGSRMARSRFHAQFRVRAGDEVGFPDLPDQPAEVRELLFDPSPPAILRLPSLNGMGDMLLAEVLPLLEGELLVQVARRLSEDRAALSLGRVRVFPVPRENRDELALEREIGILDHDLFLQRVSWGYHIPALAGRQATGR